MKDPNNYTVLTLISSGDIFHTYTELFIIMKHDDFITLNNKVTGEDLDLKSLMKLPIPLIRLLDSGRITSSELVFEDGSRYYLKASYIDIEASFPKHIFAKDMFKYRLNKKYK